MGLITQTVKSGSKLSRSITCRNVHLCQPPFRDKRRDDTTTVHNNEGSGHEYQDQVGLMWRWKGIRLRIGDIDLFYEKIQRFEYLYLKILMIVDEAKEVFLQYPELQTTVRTN
uniref:SFRICE_014822 n=1 Tax=Spodoptera frugiperda TaxID=7108 RepID=A0A2H1VC37_SPOFR